MNRSSSPTRSAFSAMSVNSWNTNKTISARIENMQPSGTIRDVPSFTIADLGHSPPHFNNSRTHSIASASPRIRLTENPTLISRSPLQCPHANTFPSSRPDSIASSATAKPSLYTSKTLSSEQWSAQPSGGIRTDLKVRRGILTHCAPGTGGHFQANIESILRYTFTNGDLLEEALESPGSGITCVGKTYRQCEEGNKQLAKVGGKVLKLVILDQCYTFRIDNQKHIINKMIGRGNLFKVGKNTKIESWVRNKMPKQEGKTRNPFRLLIDDARTENSMRTIERAMQAIIGAVYFDGGFEAARRTMAQLGLTIKAGNENDHGALVDVGFGVEGEEYRDDEDSVGSQKFLLR